jgi:TrmH family RNA methyltransferase
MSIGVVLVSPKYPGNVGAVMRLMANFNLKTLHLVDPRADLSDPELISFAQGAEKRVTLKVFRTLPEALKPFQIVLATSSGRGRRKPHLKEIGGLSDSLTDLPARARVALLLGAEDRGLSQEEMSLAHEVFRIPTHGPFPVMNLAQAAAVTIFQATRGAFEGPGERWVLAGGRELQGLFGHLREVLLEIGFLPRENPGHIMKDLKNILLRARLSPRDVLILRGILRQVRNYPVVLKARKKPGSG